MTEDERLVALAELEILDTPAEKDFDDLVRLASAICDTPIGLITLVDRDRQWFKAVLGLDIRETTRDVSFCTHAIQQPELFVVEDACLDPRFVDNALVTGEPHIRFYAGVPLKAPSGASIGTLCVIDTVPRTITERQRQAMSILAAKTQARIDLRAKNLALMRSLDANRELCSKLRASNELFLSFMNHGPFASYVKDADGRMVFYNKYLADASGVSDRQWLGLRDEEIWPSANAAKFRSDDLFVLQGGLPVERDDTSHAADGSLIHWKTIKFPYIAADGVTGLAGISIDVTRDVEREEELQRTLAEKALLADQLVRSQHMFRSFMENIPNHAYIQNDEGRLVFYNREVEDFYGIGSTAWLNRPAYELLPPHEAEARMAQDRLIMAGSANVETIDDATDCLGRTRKLRSVKFVYKDLSGHTMLAKISQDITEQLAQAEDLAHATEQLRLMATTDFLTGLSTRRVFATRACEDFASWQQRDVLFSILTLDIDNFKLRNDRYGHAAGDAALALVGSVLSKCIRVDDLAARLGGEEFGVLLPNATIGAAMKVADRIQAALQEEEHGPLPLTVSIGVATVTDACASWEQLLSQSDTAMYCAKQSGKNRIVPYIAAFGRASELRQARTLTA